MAVELETVRRVEGEIWTQALAAERDSAPAARLLHPALNHMLDISTNRTMAMNMHPPTAIYARLFGLALIASMIAGYGMARDNSALGFTSSASRRSLRWWPMSSSISSIRDWGSSGSTRSIRR